MTSEQLFTGCRQKSGKELPDNAVCRMATGGGTEVASEVAKFEVFWVAG